MKRISLTSEDGTWHCPEVRVARSYWQRLRGLLCRPPLNRDEALLLIPGGSVHTLGMRYVIDVVHLDATWRAIRIHSRLQACRVALAPASTRYTLELASGMATGLIPSTRLVPNESSEDSC